MVNGIKCFAEVKQYCCCCCYSTLMRLRMLLSSAWAPLGVWVSSALLRLSKAPHLYTSSAGYTIHRCCADSSASAHSLHVGSSFCQTSTLHFLRAGWWPCLNLVRSTLSARLSSSSFSLTLQGNLSPASLPLGANLSATISLITALFTLRSITNSPWAISDHSVACSSAISFPVSPQCPGTHST